MAELRPVTEKIRGRQAADMLAQVTLSLKDVPVTESGRGNQNILAVTRTQIVEPESGGRIHFATSAPNEYTTTELMYGSLGTLIGRYDTKDVTVHIPEGKYRSSVLSYDHPSDDGGMTRESYIFQQKKRFGRWETSVSASETTWAQGQSFTREPQRDGEIPAADIAKRLNAVLSRVPQPS
jgi:hypothetical protein